VNSEKEFTLKTTAFHSPSHLAGTGGEVFSRRDTSSIETKVTFAERFDNVVQFDKVVQGTVAALYRAASMEERTGKGPSPIF
jgi:hypothetical protein